MKRKELITERLVLREFKETDYDDLFEYLSQLKDDEFYAIELKESGKVIGNIYYGNRDFEAKEVGYIVNKNYQRKGYAREALSAVIENAFEEGIHRIFAECDPRNTCSWKLLEKVGLEREAHFKQNIFFHRDDNGMPKWKDTFVYAIVKK